MNLADIREALADELEAIPDVRVSPYWTDAIATSSTGITQLYLVGDDDYIDYLGAMSGGLADVSFVVRALVPRGGDEVQAQRRLDELLSAGTGNVRSVWDALMPSDGSPQTLGGLIDSLVPTRGRVAGVVEVQGADYLVAEIDVSVAVKRVRA